MATNSSFTNMLKRYMPTDMLVEEMRKRNYFLKTVKKDPSWRGRSYEIPFEVKVEGNGKCSDCDCGKNACEHEWVDVGFSQPKWICKKCDKEKCEGDCEGCDKK